jgi:hypothetical protein
MAKLIMQLEIEGGLATYNSPEISEAQMLRFRDYLWKFNQPLDINGNPQPRNLANEATAFQTWGGWQWEKIKDVVIKNEKIQAAEAASDAVADII